MEETARGEQAAVYARKIIQQDCMDTNQRAKNQWQDAVKAVKENKLIVQEKLHVHQKPTRKMSSVCVRYQLRSNIKILILFIAPL